jgi:hypothetical protein
MVNLEPPFRPATIDDAPVLAELVNYAGEGLPHYLWSTLVEPGEDASDIGRRRAAREEGSFSYRNAAIIERNGQCAGCLIGYEIPDDPNQSLMTCRPCSCHCNSLRTVCRARGT